jgi:DMSO/TMAO reductase YedYZ molybdopterin-dependent catalytic subunit
VVALLATLWLVYPLLQKRLQPMNLTLVALNGTTVILKESDISNLESFSSKGGFKTSAGSLRGIGTYVGVRLVDLCNLVGGIDSHCSLRVSANDGYSMVYTYDQVMGENLVTFDPATGNEKNSAEPLTMILAYYKDAKDLTSEDGAPLRLAILGSEGLLTDGNLWVKYVDKIEIRPVIEDWTLTLKGALDENMSRATFESGVNCQTAHHAVNWTDEDNHVWTGLPLWLLVGRVDDSDVHVTNASMRAFNDTLALQGYTVKLISGLGYSREFNSSRVRYNYGIILANRCDGDPLKEPYWPLRLVGPGLVADETLANVVEIQLNLPGK